MLYLFIISTESLDILVWAACRRTPGLCDINSSKTTWQIALRFYWYTGVPVGCLYCLSFLQSVSEWIGQEKLASGHRAGH